MTEGPGKKPQPWPFPEHSVQDRDRFIAQIYRGALIDTLNGKRTPVEAVDQYIATFGISWPFMNPKLPAGDIISRDEVAELAQVRPSTVSQWATRGYLTRCAGGGYHFAEVREFLEKELPGKRRQSAERAAELDL